ncbi:unnamed protein product [Peniophora sp. CBMAI 1063]|nr:unnamed protein product [Peniophora sp. CBMAI 1063]
MHVIAPIHRIPVEALAHIFCCVLQPGGQKPSPHRERTPPALLLRSICRRWRAVAEDTSSLWPDIVGRHGFEWTRRALSWSKECSLNIHLCDISYGQYRDKRMTDWDASVALVIAEIHRARSIAIECEPVYTPLVRQALRSALRRLETLDVRYIDALDASSLAGEVPTRLKDLALAGITAPLGCPALMAPLTSLHVCECIIWASMDELLCTLSNLPNLENFEWTQFIPTQAYTFLIPPLHASTESRPKLILLARLRTIYVRTCVECITYLLTHIASPNSCNVTVDAYIETSGSEDMDQLLPALDSAFGKSLRAAFPISDEREGYQSLTIDGFEGYMSEGMTFIWTKPTAITAPTCFHLGFLPAHDSDGQASPILLVIAEHILDHWTVTHRALSHLRLVHPTFYDIIDPESPEPQGRPWSRILRLLQSLEHLEAHHNVCGLGDALTLGSSGITNPHLQRIDIQEASLSEGEFFDLINSIRMSNSYFYQHGSVRRSRILRLLDCDVEDTPIELTVGQPGKAIA